MWLWRSVFGPKTLFFSPICHFCTQIGLHGNRFITKMPATIVWKTKVQDRYITRKFGARACKIRRFTPIFVKKWRAPSLVFTKITQICTDTSRQLARTDTIMIRKRLQNFVPLGQFVFKIQPSERSKSRRLLCDLLYSATAVVYYYWFEVSETCSDHFAMVWRLSDPGSPNLVQRVKCVTAPMP